MMTKQNLCFDAIVNIGIAIIVLAPIISGRIQDRSPFNKPSKEAALVKQSCIRDHDRYCSDKPDDFKYSDGCRDCGCFSRQPLCKTTFCVHFQPPGSTFDEYCDGVLRKNHHRPRHGMPYLSDKSVAAMSSTKSRAEGKMVAEDRTTTETPQPTETAKMAAMEMKGKVVEQQVVEGKLLAQSVNNESTVDEVKILAGDIQAPSSQDQLPTDVNSIEEAKHRTAPSLEAVRNVVEETGKKFPEPSRFEGGQREDVSPHQEERLLEFGRSPNLQNSVKIFRIPLIEPLKESGLNSISDHLLPLEHFDDVPFDHGVYIHHNLRGPRQEIHHTRSSMPGSRRQERKDLFALISSIFGRGKPTAVYEDDGWEEDMGQYSGPRFEMQHEPAPRLPPLSVRREHRLPFWPPSGYAPEHETREWYDNYDGMGPSFRPEPLEMPNPMLMDYNGFHERHPEMGYAGFFPPSGHDIVKKHKIEKSRVRRTGTSPIIKKTSSIGMKEIPEECRAVCKCETKSIESEEQMRELKDMVKRLKKELTEKEMRHKTCEEYRTRMRTALKSVFSSGKNESPSLWRMKGWSIVIMLTISRFMV